MADVGAEDDAAIDDHVDLAAVAAAMTARSLETLDAQAFTRTLHLHPSFCTPSPCPRLNAACSDSHFHDVLELYVIIVFSTSL